MRVPKSETSSKRKFHRQVPRIVIAVQTRRKFNSKPTIASLRVLEWDWVANLTRLDTGATVPFPQKNTREHLSERDLEEAQSRRS